MLTPLKAPRYCLFYGRRANDGKITTSTGVLLFDVSDIIELKRSKLGLLKSTFNAENFMRRLSWSISNVPEMTPKYTPSLKKQSKLFLS